MRTAVSRDTPGKLVAAATSALSEQSSVMSITVAVSMSLAMALSSPAGSSVHS